MMSSGDNNAYKCLARNGVDIVVSRALLAVEKHTQKRNDGEILLS